MSTYQETNTDSLAQAQELSLVSYTRDVKLAFRLSHVIWQSTHLPQAAQHIILRAGGARAARTLGAPAHELDTLLGELGGDLEKLLNLVGHVGRKEELRNYKKNKKLM
jgi:hypothetical protein